MNPYEHQAQDILNVQRQMDGGKTVLFVSDLAENLNESELDVFFQDFKSSILLIQSNRVVRSNDSKVNVNATVVFKDPVKADEARNALNLRKLKGKTVRIMWHERDNSLRYSNQANVFVKNIPTHVKPRDFYEFFVKFGDIVSAKLCEDDDGNHYGYGYIHFATEVGAEAARNFCSNNQVWDTSIDVKSFQKKNERNPMNNNKNVYVKNIPSTSTESEIKAIFNKYGQITWMKLVDDKHGKFAIIIYDNDDSTKKAIDGENKKMIGGNELFVDTLMKKADRKKFLVNKLSDYNYKLNSKFKNSNLHIRNLPLDCTEDDLNDIFSHFGEITSLKINKYMLVTKVNNEFKEYPTSSGFGYLCYTTEEAAKAAIDNLSGKPFDKFPRSKRPILIDFFMPKYERQNVFSRLQQQFNPNNQKKLLFPNPIQSFGQGYPMLNFHPQLAKHVKFPPQQPMYPGPGTFTNIGVMPIAQQPINPIQSRNKQIVNNVRYEEPDLKYMNSLEDDHARKDYLGEFIFKKIENHEIIRDKMLPMDTIGKITGMILGIDDFKEIVDISKDYHQLTVRIQEALELLEVAK